jgi:cell division protein FtsB
MIRRKKNNLSKKYLNQKLFALLLIILIVLISIPLAKNISKRYEVNIEIRDLEDEISGVEAKNKELGNLIDYLKSDQFLEEQARLNLNLKKEGEKVVIVKNETLATTSESNNPGVEISNFQRWINYFFKK